MGIPRNNHPLIMGIVNMTPDSFYQPIKNNESEYFNKLDYRYADIIDVGCESSRPGAQPISEKKELYRLNKFLEQDYNLPDILSIDTYKPCVARFALENGFNMINDIKSGDNNDLMLKLAAEYDCPIVLMHMKGEPSTMQENPFYNDIMDDIKIFFEKKIKIAESLGISNNNIILDPGIGFGKRIEDNDIILKNLYKLKQFNYPILVGLSRKSFLSINGDEAHLRLSATLGATVIAMQQDIDILRVHDAKETFKLKSIFKRINNMKQNNTEKIFN